MTTCRGCYTFVMAPRATPLSSCTPTVPAAGTPGPADGPGPCLVGPTRAAPIPTRPTSAWRSRPCSRHCGLSCPTTPGAIEVVSDSNYVVKCFTDEWWKGWQRRNWKNTANKPVANRDLWEPLLALALDESVAVSFRWVKGHSGDRWNDRVDELATQAADAGVGATG